MNPLKGIGKGVLLLAVLAILAGCSDERGSLASTLEPARGRIEDASGRQASVDDILAAARGRPVSVSFAYVGCGGRTPRMERLEDAATTLDGREGDILHVVLNAVDEPGRYGELVRDLTGGDAPLDPERLRVFFVDKGELWPKEPSAAVDGVLGAMGMRYGQGKLIETVSGIGLFDANGAFRGIRY